MPYKYLIVKIFFAGAPPPTPKAPALLTEANDAVLKKIDSIIVEYLHLQDVKVSDLSSKSSRK